MSTRPISVTMTESQWLQIHQAISQVCDPMPIAVTLARMIEQAISLARCTCPMCSENQAETEQP